MFNNHFIGYQMVTTRVGHFRKLTFFFIVINLKVYTYIQYTYGVHVGVYTQDSCKTLLFI